MDTKKGTFLSVNGRQVLLQSLTAALKASNANSTKRMIKGGIHSLNFYL